MFKTCRKSKASPPRIFTDDDAVWAMTKGDSQQVPDRHCRGIRLLSPGFKSDQVALTNADLRRVFDEDDAFFVWNKVGQDVEQGCLSSPGAAADQDVLPAFDFCLEDLGQFPVERPQGNQIVDREVFCCEFPDGEGDASHAAGWNDGCYPTAIGQTSIQNGFRFRDIISQ